MQFDPVVALILTVIIGLLTYVYKMHYQSKNDEIDFTVLAPAYDLALFSTAFPDRDAYEAVKDGGELPDISDLEKDNEDFQNLTKMLSGASGDNPESLKRKTLVALLLKRAMVAVKRGTEMHQELPNVAALEQSGGLKQEDALKVKAAIEAIQDEQKSIVAEAESVRPSWGQHILPMAAQLGMSPEEKKQMIEARQKAQAAQAAAQAAAAPKAAVKNAKDAKDSKESTVAKSPAAAKPAPQNLPVVNWSIFADEYPERDAYNAAVKGQAPKNPTKEDEAFEKMVGQVSGASGDTPESQKRKMLTALLMKRAIATVRRDIMMRQETNKIAHLDAMGMLLEADAKKARKAIETIQQEQKIIVVEAESMRPGWGANILPMAFEMGVNLETKKQIRAQSNPSTPPQSKPTSSPSSPKPAAAKPASTDKSTEKSAEKSTEKSTEKSAEKPSTNQSSASQSPAKPSTPAEDSDKPKDATADVQKTKVSPAKKKTPKA